MPRLGELLESAAEMKATMNSEATKPDYEHAEIKIELWSLQTPREPYDRWWTLRFDIRVHEYYMRATVVAVV